MTYATGARLEQNWSSEGCSAPVPPKGVRLEQRALPTEAEWSTER
jgi:hypothetical protein